MANKTYAYGIKNHFIFAYQSNRGDRIYEACMCFGSNGYIYQNRAEFEFGKSLFMAEIRDSCSKIDVNNNDNRMFAFWIIWLLM